MRFFKRKGKPGEYKGRYYAEYVDDVKNLKRQGKLVEVETLLLALIDVMETETKVNKTIVGPWYYEQFAIMYRERKDYSAEVSILERYAEHPHIPKAALLERLQKAQALRDGTKV